MEEVNQTNDLTVHAARRANYMANKPSHGYKTVPFHELTPDE